MKTIVNQFTFSVLALSALMIWCYREVLEIVETSDLLLWTVLFYIVVSVFAILGQVIRSVFCVGMHVLMNVYIIGMLVAIFGTDMVYDSGFLLVTLLMLYSVINGAILVAQYNKKKQD
jgi:hypothetical protein